MNFAAIGPLLTRPAATEERPVFCRPYGLLLLAFAVGYLLVFCAAFPTFIDEAYSFNLATDKSLTHMFAALRNGADGSFPLYALLVHGWAKIFGSSELSLRLNSGLFVLLFVWHSGNRLSRYFPSPMAALAILFALSEANFIYYALQARFYGLVIFLFSLCFWSTWDLIRSSNNTHWHRLRHATICGILCLSHPLGLVYTGLLCVLYLTFSGVVRSLSVLDLLSFLGGPALFLVWLPSFLSQRLVNPSYHDILVVPWWSKYWLFAFFNSRALFVANIMGLLLFLVGRWLFSSKQERVGEQREVTETGVESTVDSESQRKLRVRLKRFLHHAFRLCTGRNYPGPSDKAVLILYAIAFIISLNAAVAILDGLRIIPVYWMRAVRYVLVGWVAYCVVVAAILTGAAGFMRHLYRPDWSYWCERIQFFVVLAGLLWLMQSDWQVWVKEKAEEQSYLQEVSRIANEQHLTVVCDSHWDAFFLTSRTHANQVAYLLEDNFPFARFLLQVSKYYPRPSPIYPIKPGVSPSEQLRSTNAYLFIRRSPREAKVIIPTQP
jgi:hypothetical protein